MLEVLFPFGPTLLLLAVLGLWQIDTGNVILINGRLSPPVRTVHESALGFEFSVGEFYSYYGWSLVVPYWFLAVLASLPLATQLLRRARRDWRADCVSQLFCPECGYDLCATPERCP